MQSTVVAWLLLLTSVLVAASLSPPCSPSHPRVVDVAGPRLILHIRICRWAASWPWILWGHLPAVRSHQQGSSYPPMLPCTICANPHRLRFL